MATRAAASASRCARALLAGLGASVESARAGTALMPAATLGPACRPGLLEVLDALLFGLRAGVFFTYRNRSKARGQAQSKLTLRRKSYCFLSFARSRQQASKSSTSPPTCSLPRVASLCSTACAARSSQLLSSSLSSSVGQPAGATSGWPPVRSQRSAWRDRLCDTQRGASATELPRILPPSRNAANSLVFELRLTT